MAAYDRKSYSGNAVPTSLASNISAADTLINTVSSTGYPDGSGGPYEIVLNPHGATEEKVLCSSRSGTAHTVATGGRGYDGTSAAAHSAGESVEHILTAIDLDEANQVVHATLGAVTAKGDMLVATAAGTLGKLAVGNAGQVLTADASQATGLRWGSAATFVPATAFTAKGDVLVGTASGAYTHLVVGTDGQVLTVSAGTPVWAAPPAVLSSVVDQITLRAGGSATAYAFPAATVTAISKNSTGQAGGMITRMITINFSGAVATGTWTITGLSTSFLYSVNNAAYTGYLTTSGTLRGAILTFAAGGGTGTLWVSNASGVYVQMDTATFAVANNDVLALSVAQ